MLVVYVQKTSLSSQFGFMKFGIWYIGKMDTLELNDTGMRTIYRKPIVNTFENLYADLPMGVEWE